LAWGRHAASIQYTKATYNFLLGQPEEKDILDGVIIHENKENKIKNDPIDVDQHEI